MEKLQVVWKKSVLVRLILTFLCILIPVYILGIFIYSWSVNTIRTDISGSMLTQCSSFIDTFESAIMNIQMLQNSTLVDDDLSDLVNRSSIMSRYQKQSAELRLLNRLIAIKSSNTMIENVRAHIPVINRLIEANGSIGELLMDDLEFLKDIKIPQGNHIIYREDRIYLVGMALLGNNTNSEVSHVIDVSITKTKLNSILKNSETYNSGGSVLVNTNTGFIIASDIKDEIFRQIEANLVKKPGKEIDAVKIGNKRFLIAFANSDYLNMTLYKFVAEEEIFGKLKMFRIWFILFTAVALTIIILYSIFTYEYIRKPLVKLIQSFYRAESGEQGFAVQYAHDDEFGYLYQGFNKMIKRLEQMIAQVYTEKLLAQRAELKQLQTQVNPHFLYNSFFILHRIILGGDEEKAAAFSERLGNYFKYITRNSSDEVTLSAEVEHARVYVGIQEMRFSKRLKIEFESVPEKYTGLMVPRLILQPVLENPPKSISGRMYPLFIPSMRERIWYGSCSPQTA